MPYEGEVAEGEYIVVSYVSNDGNASYVFAAYNAETKRVTFKTNHFSNYAIFVSGSPSVVVNEGTGNGICEVGTTETTFSPDMGCTRAQIVTFLARAFGE